MAEKNLGGTKEQFLENMTEIVEEIDTLEEDSREIAKLQQKVKGAAIQNERDKEKLTQLREAHVQTGIEIKDALKKELDLLRQQELMAEQSGTDILDENNELYIMRAKIMENYKKFLDSWDSFHRNQVSYLEDIRNKLTARFKVVKEDATEDEVKTLLDPTKENHINIMLNDPNMRPSEAKDLKYRVTEMNQLEKFIGETHNLKTLLEGLLTNQPEAKEPDIEKQEPRKESWFLIKFLEQYGIKVSKRTVVITFGLLFTFLVVIIIASSVSSGEPTKPVIATTTEDPYKEPSIEPAPPST